MLAQDAELTQDAAAIGFSSSIGWQQRYPRRARGALNKTSGGGAGKGRPARCAGGQATSR